MWMEVFVEPRVRRRSQLVGHTGVDLSRPRQFRTKTDKRLKLCEGHRVTGHVGRQIDLDFAYALNIDHKSGPSLKFHSAPVDIWQAVGRSAGRVYQPGRDWVKAEMACQSRKLALDWQAGQRRSGQSPTGLSLLLNEFYPSLFRRARSGQSCHFLSSGLTGRYSAGKCWATSEKSSGAVTRRRSAPGMHPAGHRTRRPDHSGI